MSRAATVLLLPTLRLRDLLRPVVEAEIACCLCRHRGPLDAVDLLCRTGRHERLTKAVKDTPCPRCGAQDALDWCTRPQLLRYAARVSALVGARGPLGGTCGACRRRWAVDVLDAVERLGPDVTLRELAERLVCPACGQRGWARLALAGRVDAAGQGGEDGRMCGRYSIHSGGELLASRFGITHPLPGDLTPRWNAAPTQQLPVVRRHPDGGRALGLLRWGLVPRWAKDLSIGARMINARAETVGTSNAFAPAFAKRRCLVPLDSFFEWRKEGKTKQPIAFATTENGPSAFAGLWEGWQDTTGAWVHTYTIITTTPNDLVAPVHDRMPVILPTEAWATWLGEEPAGPADLQALLVAYPADRMRAWTVDRAVGNVANDRPELVAPISPA
ncbi:putative SOS response-associated peptidase YedK/predicted RNA-binding Zn-ribbon protein involved in translation (DUF1610 family) [Azospirillum agricola]|uniref:SOS response-associated peptidase n=1 Tax=Azospirillum agricola TaxID=1720247 RepID=UPI001F2C7E74|nr:SOS response-associated peptidase [Azospirillum agricola]MBP2233133.1 putative SOS response-associated peptidase YedK/predicted RNA-binding Zn-ribbon protein involved in translation (DUF1610 family) [Azospirillum agricola]